MNQIRMVDIHTQYLHIKEEIDSAIQNVLDSSQFIKGPVVSDFERNLEEYIGVQHVVSCANGTDALRIALMALQLEPGDEVLTSGFSFAAAVEMILSLGLKPVLVDAEENGFNMSVSDLESKITSKSKAIIPVHLFGECCDMEAIMTLAETHNLWVIEDNAQSIGAEIVKQDGSRIPSGTAGHVATLSFFPSKNLACFGDGGAVYTNNSDLAKRMRMIGNHGSVIKYQHEMLGMNSRLDAMQAAVLNVKLKYLDEYTSKRRKAAEVYDNMLKGSGRLTLPTVATHSTHVYHQYTLCYDGDRDQLRNDLQEKGVPTMVYYPKALNQHKAYESCYAPGSLPRAESLAEQVISIPIHTELDEEQQAFIVKQINELIESQSKIEIQ